MYRYDQYDQAMVDARVEEFRDQTRRYLAGELTDSGLTVMVATTTTGMRGPPGTP